MKQAPHFGQVPFVRLLLPFVAGIILALVSLNRFIWEFWLVLALIAFLFYILIALVFPLKWSLRWVPGLWLNVLFLLLGVTFTSLFPTQSSIETDEPVECTVKLLEPAEKRTSSLRVMAAVQQIKKGNRLNELNEKVILYFNVTDSMAQQLAYGSVLALKARFNRVENPKNPYEFNYAGYLARRGIFRTAYISKDHWSILGIEQQWLKSYAFFLRGRLLELFEASGVKGQNLAVASALVMGYKSLLDEETQRAFSASGAMHILAVSGLHVGILFIILASILFLFDRFKHGKYIKAALLILALWGYALFTGLSPSVMRASLMFSLVVVGKALSRSTNIYNTLSASAFILLVANPMLITEVGFQLSYAAVVAIVFFYPHIYSWLYFRNRFYDKVWALIAVSLAAQLGTFPLGLYYFNQFPNYFLLTNLFAIPLATVIIYLTLALVALSPVAFIANALGWLLNETIGILNFLVTAIERLPASTLEGVVITPWQVVILYLSIAALGLLMLYKRAIYAMALLTALVFYFGMSSYHSIAKLSICQMAVFNIRGTTAIGFSENARLVVISNEPDFEVLPRLKGYLSEMRIKQPVELIGTGSHETKQNPIVTCLPGELGLLLHFRGKSILVPLGDSEIAAPVRPVTIDQLIITSGNRRNFNNLLTFVAPRQVVIDASLPAWKADYIKRQALPMAIPVHSTQTDGAFILDFR